MARHASPFRAPLIVLVAAMAFPLLSRAAPVLVPKVKPRAELAPALQACLQLTHEHLVATATHNLSAAEKANVRDVVSLLKSGKRDAAVARWQALIRSVTAHAGSGQVDVNALVQYVVRESYLETTDDLRYYAEKVSYYNEAKTRLRGYRDAVGGKKPPVSALTLPVPRPKTLSQAHGGPIAPPLTSIRLALRDDTALQAYLQRTEDELNSIGDDSQLANVDMQNALQEQQQVLQMLSIMSKVLYDTAMAIIHKLD